MDIRGGSLRLPVGSGISILGLVFFLHTGSHIFREMSVIRLTVINVVPLVLSGFVVWAGYWIATSDLKGTNVGLVLVWMVVGMLMMVSMALIITFYEQIHGIRLVDFGHVATNNLITGAAGGLSVGYFQVRSRERAADLAEERAALAEKSEQLTLMNRIVRHDIRNDLNVALGMMELATSESDEEAEYLAKATRALTNAVYLTETTRDFVEMLDDGDPEFQQLDLCEQLSQQVESVGESYPNATLTLTAPDACYVQASPLVSSVFRNLLTNAIQHNRSENPRVDVSLDVEDGHSVVTVADDGPGIPSERRESIFGQGEKGLESEGTGVGLYLVERLVTAHDGDVRIEESDLGGAAFVVTLPTERPVS